MAIKDSFPEILEEAARLPEPDIAELLSPFSSPLPRGERYVDTSKEIEAKKLPKYNYTAHIQRFIIGANDDTVLYEAVINRALKGDVIIRFEERSITKEGDVIIALSWLEPIEKKSVANGDSTKVLATLPGTT